MLSSGDDQNDGGAKFHHFRTFQHLNITSPYDTVIVTKYIYTDILQCRCNTQNKLTYVYMNLKITAILLVFKNLKQNVKKRKIFTHVTSENYNTFVLYQTI